MTGKTHLFGGIAAGVAVIQVTDAAPGPVLILSTLCALLPDICHRGSRIGRKLKIVSWLVSSLFGHRTVTHSLLFLGVGSWLLYLFAPDPAYAYGYAAGVSSHLLLDALTAKGIQLFWPIPWRIRFPLYTKTGGVVEWFVLMALIGYIGYAGLAVQ
ncbi:metal-dependent hydrolase [Bacillaceae bacterium SIJ1]|uniref:metal-dependent hydrolase n=1 Tax=Litoribacterium kuwaitense TaxID=1398745 RepID=UPI0013EA3663|nr:metal-dependent hydrolase [Litoribacterium kuwaitense]NGP45246.1 metal-dependent hydrolase [Litoribacterium kuwaitense]